MQEIRGRQESTAGQASSTHACSPLLYCDGSQGDMICLKGEVINQGKTTARVVSQEVQLHSEEDGSNWLVFFSKSQIS